MNDWKQRPKLLPHVLGEGWPRSSGSHGPGAETSDESVAFSHCIPGNLPLVTGLGGGHPRKRVVGGEIIDSHEINL